MGSSPILGTNINNLKFNKIMLFVYIIEQYVSDGTFVRANDCTYKDKEKAVNICERLTKLIGEHYRVKTLPII